MNIKKIVGEKLGMVFKKLGLDEENARVSFSAAVDICHMQCNGVFKQAKISGENPVILANKIVENSVELKNDFDIAVAGSGYINLTFKNHYLSEIAKMLKNEKNYGVEEHGDKKNILLDYGGANIAKELHVGHLRSPIIGESLKELFKLKGDIVVSDAHLGDWGLQMGLTLAQLEDDGYWAKFINENPKLNKTYFKKPITLDVLNEEYPKASKRKDVEPLFKKKADDYTLYIQQKIYPYYEMYKEIKSVSIKAIEENYRQLNANFNLWLGESDASSEIDNIIKIFKEKGLARESEGALVVDVAREGEHIKVVNPDGSVQYKNPMPPAIIQKYNGGDLYATTDLATISQRSLKGYDEIVYITDKRQALHFEQVFRCARMAKLVSDEVVFKHIGFGTMNGTDGKPYKTRSGGVVKLEDVINLLKNKAAEKLKENGAPFDDELALEIGVAAMKFGDLSNVVNKDYVFDIDKFLAFEGKTGPYIQYTAVRIKSLLDKSNEKFEKISVSNKEEKEIVINILKLIDCYDICYNDYSLNALCLGVYNLASSYSTFYNNYRILSEKDDLKRESYLALSKLVLEEIKIALQVLAINIPERM